MSSTNNPMVFIVLPLQQPTPTTSPQSTSILCITFSCINRCFSLIQHEFHRCGVFLALSCQGHSCQFVPKYPVMMLMLIPVVNAFPLFFFFFFLHYEITICPFEINGNIWGDGLKLYKYHIPHLYLLVLASSDNFSKKSIICYLVDRWHSTVRIDQLFLDFISFF